MHSARAEHNWLLASVAAAMCIQHQLRRCCLALVPSPARCDDVSAEADADGASNACARGQAPATASARHRRLTILATPTERCFRHRVPYQHEEGCCPPATILLRISTQEQLFPAVCVALRTRARQAPPLAAGSVVGPGEHGVASLSVQRVVSAGVLASK